MVVAAIPPLTTIRAALAQLGPRIRRTPVWRWDGPAVLAALGPETDVALKLEIWQRAGSFKIRGALCAMLALDAEQRTRGVTAFSAGNHALALATAARDFGVGVKVVMPENANPARIAACRALGAELVSVPTVRDARETVARIVADEGRCAIHPFDDEAMILGAATLGLELCAQVPQLDAVVVPIGGGGLCAGIAAAVRQLRPEAKVYGVEPTGADTMRRSLDAGEPVAIDAVRSFADSLGAPRAEPRSFAICRDLVEDVVTLPDETIAAAMRVLFDELKLAVEPAAAAATAAAVGPLAERLRGGSVVLIACGTNTDLPSFVRNASLGLAGD